MYEKELHIELPFDNFSWRCGGFDILHEKFVKHLASTLNEHKEESRDLDYNDDEGILYFLEQEGILDKVYKKIRDDIENMNI